MNDQTNRSVAIDNLLQNLGLKIAEYVKSNIEPGHITTPAFNPTKRRHSKSSRAQSTKPCAMTSTKQLPSSPLKPTKIQSPVPAMMLTPVPMPVEESERIQSIVPILKTSSSKVSTIMSPKVVKSVKFAKSKSAPPIPDPSIEQIEELEKCLITIAQYINPNLGDCLETCVDQNYEI
ncbi:unnamed protein product [Rodentolepis nana]|uniref:NET domain-containing protein n=1 Tax=Rodentolepis nana TaxID=102285 RepID=A0A0R3TUN6_RODNA|nr:unnamed protein product [Rodentolepis nana]